MIKPKLKLVAFDMDGTITREKSSWEFLHRRLDIWNELAEKYQEKFLAGEISYKEFCDLDAAMWHNLPLSNLVAILKEIPVRRSAPEVINTIKNLGAKPVLISTGLKLLADLLDKQLEFWSCASNELLHRQGKMTGYCTVHVCTEEQGKTKKAHLKKIKTKLNISNEETVVVGDSAGDLGMMLEAGLSIAVDPGEYDLAALRKNIPGLVIVRSLKEILPVIYLKFDIARPK